MDELCEALRWLHTRRGGLTRKICLPVAGFFT